MTKSDDGGAGYVERVGWVPEDQQHPKRFTATVVFPDGPPPLPAATVWRRTPVYLVLATPAPAPQPVADAGAEPPLLFTYQNWRGEENQRRVTPISVRYGSTEWHPEPTWLLRAFDHDKGAEREFAMRDMGVALPPVADSGWQPIATAPKDGTRVLYLTRLKNNWEYGVCYFSDDTDEKVGWFCDASGADVHPTHWRPLPAPPGAAPQPAPDQAQAEAVATGRELIWSDGIVYWRYADGSHRGLSRADVDAVNAAIRARSTPAQNAPEPVADRAAEPAGGEGIIKSLASRLRYAADGLDKGLGDRDAHWADIHGVADTLARLGVSRGVSEVMITKAYEAARATTEAR